MNRNSVLNRRTCAARAKITEACGQEFIVEVEDGFMGEVASGRAGIVTSFNVLLSCSTVMCASLPMTGVLASDHRRSNAPIRWRESEWVMARHMTARTGSTEVRPGPAFVLKSPAKVDPLECSSCETLK
jgi:hypothetical protein